MKKQKRSLKYKLQHGFVIIVILCWCAALGQTVHDNYFNDRAVPAYQNKTLKQDDTQNAFQNMSDSGKDSTQSISDSGKDSLLNISDKENNSSQGLPGANLIFQSKKSQTWEIAEFPDKLTRDSALSYCQTLINTLTDTDWNDNSTASLISSGVSSGYSDFYFYCPFLLENFSLTPYDSGGSNLQIVLTWNKDGSCSHVYLGFPFVEYCF